MKVRIINATLEDFEKIEDMVDKELAVYEETTKDLLVDLMPMFTHNTLVSKLNPYVDKVTGLFSSGEFTIHMIPKKERACNGDLPPTPVRLKIRLRDYAASDLSKIRHLIAPGSGNVSIYGVEYELLSGVKIREVEEALKPHLKTFEPWHSKEGYTFFMIPPSERISRIIEIKGPMTGGLLSHTHNLQQTLYSMIAKEWGKKLDEQILFGRPRATPVGIFNSTFQIKNKEGQVIMEVPYTNPCGEVAMDIPKPITGIKSNLYPRKVLIKGMNGDDYEVLKELISEFKLTGIADEVELTLNHGLWPIAVEAQMRRYGGICRGSKVDAEGRMIMNVIEHVKINKTKEKIEEDETMITRSNLVVTRGFIDRVFSNSSVWMTADRREIPICELGDSHLKNIISLLEDCKDTIHNQHLNMVKTELKSLRDAKDIMMASMGQAFSALEISILNRSEELKGLDCNQGQMYLNRMPMYIKLKAEYQKRFGCEEIKKEIKELNKKLATLGRNIKGKKNELKGTEDSIKSYTRTLESLQDRRGTLQLELNDMECERDAAQCRIDALERKINNKAF